MHIWLSIMTVIELSQACEARPDKLTSRISKSPLRFILAHFCIVNRTMA